MAKGSARADSGRMQYGAGRIVCGRRFCGRCGKWRHVVDFPAHNRRRGYVTKLSNWCRTCHRIDQRIRRHTPEGQAARREYERIYKAAKRREAGIPERPFTKKAKRGPDAQHVASTTVDGAVAVAFIEAEAERQRITVEEAVGGESAFRALTRWKNGHPASIQVVDAILLHLTGDPSKFNELYPPQAA